MATAPAKASPTNVVARASVIERASGQRFEDYLRTRIFERAGLTRTPDVYLIDDIAPNAFAAGRNVEHAYVAATTGLLRALSPDQIAARLDDRLDLAASERGTGGSRGQG